MCAHTRYLGPHTARELLYLQPIHFENKKRVTERRAFTENSWGLVQGYGIHAELFYAPSGGC